MNKGIGIIADSSFGQRSIMDQKMEKDYSPCGGNSNVENYYPGERSNFDKAYLRLYSPCRNNTVENISFQGNEKVNQQKKMMMEGYEGCNGCGVYKNMAGGVDWKPATLMDNPYNKSSDKFQVSYRF